MLENLDPFTATPRELIAAVADAAPGPLTMSVLLMIDRARLSAEDAVDFLRVAQRVAAWWESVQAEATIAAAAEHAVVSEILVAEPERDEERLIRIEDAAREEVAAALRISPAGAHERISLARLLCGPLRRTGEAMSVGDISAAHARAIAEAARRLPGHAVALREPAGDTPADATARAEFAAYCAALQDRVLRVAARGTVSMTRRAARRALLALDAEGQERRRREAMPTRDVWVSPDVDGMSVLIARMATERAHACLGAVDALAHDARFRPDGPEQVGPRRAEALASLLLQEGHAVEQGSAPRLRAHIDLTIPLGTLLGLQAEPGELAGAGAVGVDVLHDLLQDPDVDVAFRRLVTDSVDGHVVDIGRTSYRVPTRLRELIVARDRVCRFPGCQRRAARCQLDHAVAWEDGGPTTAANLGPLCVRHHQLKTHGGWQITASAPDGSVRWRSPQGREYDTRPPPP